MLFRSEFKFGIRKEDHKLFPKPEKNNTGGWVPPFQGRDDGDGYEEQRPAPRQQPQRQPARPAPRQQKPQESWDDEDEIPFT